MILSDLAVRRPVMASVLSLVIVTLGIVGMMRMSMRELPDIDAPRVSVGTNYPGAAAAVIESRVTRVIENAISGIDGIRTVSSTTTDGRSSIDIEFVLDRDIDS
ncbi:MAG TPA: efflux RND transporter permease subunit, partial [Planctomycetes bacterium]|nr:efflux RND transporter permease subunit [Planctomycetota bacterium]